MAKLTPLGKGAVTVTILCVVGAAAWHFALKDMLSGGTVATDGGGAFATPTGGGGGGGAGPGPASGALGTDGNPLRVSIVEFTGYAPALVANGGQLKTQPGSAFDRQGLSVEFLIQNDVPTLATGFGSGTFQCAWRTIDFWAQEQPGLRAGGFDGTMVMVVDNTRGADMLVADTGIGRVEDLLGKKVALVQFTPSHWMLDYAIDNSALLAPQKKALRNNLVFVGADEGTPGVRAMFESGAVQAAVLWDPDASLALRKPGAHVVFSTSTATSLVYDGIVCDSRVVAQHPEVVQRLVAGWFEGVGLAEADAGKAIDALTATEPSFADLEKKEGREFIAGLFKSIKWTDLDDNVRILGLNTGDGGDFARVYSEAGKVWRANGGIADPSVPPIPPMAAVDTRFVEALVAKKPEAKAEAAKPEFTFDPKERQAVVTPKAAPVLTKPVAVFFASGSGKLDRNAQRILDDQVAPLVQSMGNAYISVEGNTDVKGSAATNRRLSQERAQAVVDYLVANYAFDRARFNVAGNGPDKPVCSEPGEECLERNRRTDVAVYAR
ncbi:phosphate ABC transporter substrate-binding/OmpA family protein [Myxococcota bacterium]|nr:phosphate ABC transporter substrate-binding/OmpA family protein [Myxococcota bacterium]